LGNEDDEMVGAGAFAQGCLLLEACCQAFGAGRIAFD